jgi:uncharacterized protein (DUF433 family)
MTRMPCYGGGRYTHRMSEFDRIQVDPEVMLGQPVIRGTRVPVYAIVASVAEGDTTESLLAAYPFLHEEDIRQALRFAARLSEWGLEVA